MQLTKSNATGSATSTGPARITTTLTIIANPQGVMTGYAYSNEDNAQHFEFPAGSTNDSLVVNLSAPAGCYLYTYSSSNLQPVQVTPSLSNGVFPAGTTQATLAFDFSGTQADQTYVNFSVINPNNNNQVLVCDPQVGNDPEPG